MFIVASPVPTQSRGGTHRTAGNAPGMNAWHQTQHMRDTDKSCDSLFPSDTLLPSWVPPTVLPDRTESQVLGGLKGQCRAQVWTLHLQDRIKREPCRGVREPLRKCRERRVSWRCWWHFGLIWGTRLTGSCFSQVC